MYQKKKAQEALVYSLLIGVIALVLMIMFGYISRHVMGAYQQTGDAIGAGEVKD
jgi:Flp pilus assembly pilin Flp